MFDVINLNHFTPQIYKIKVESPLLHLQHNLLLAIPRLGNGAINLM
jgi:hypothetical protein